MGAADGDGVCRGRDELGEHFAAGADVSGECRNFGVICRHSGGDHCLVRGGGMGGIVPAADLHPLAFEPACTRRKRAVAAAHMIAAAPEQHGEGGHADPADADEMDGN